MRKPFHSRTLSFDVVVSLIGAMFAPRPDLVARELLRVCAPGGTIAMANWTPSGFVGQMFKAIARFIAPANMPSPLLWGDEATVHERLGSGVSQLNLSRRPYTFNYPFPPSEVVDVFRLYYGPANLAFASLDDGRQAGPSSRTGIAVVYTQPCEGRRHDRRRRVPRRGRHTSLKETR